MRISSSSPLSSLSESTGISLIISLSDQSKDQSVRGRSAEVFDQSIKYEHLTISTITQPYNFGTRMQAVKQQSNHTFPAELYTSYAKRMILTPLSAAALLVMVLYLMNPFGMIPDICSGSYLRWADETAVILLIVLILVYRRKGETSPRPVQQERQVAITKPRVKSRYAKALEELFQFIIIVFIASIVILMTAIGCLLYYLFKDSD